MRHWLTGWKAGKAVNPNTLALFRVARACGVTLEWLLTGEEPEIQASSVDPGEVERLRAQVARLTRESVNNAEIYGDAVRSRSHLQEELDQLLPELSRLRTENQALRAQATASALGPEEGRLMVRAGELLSLPGNANLEQILARVVTLFSTAQEGPPPTIHEPAAEQECAEEPAAGQKGAGGPAAERNGAGGQRAGPEKHRANSS